jgi:hypothetical protein
MATKGRRIRGLSALVALLASLVTAPMASAVVYTNQPGSVCKNYYPNEGSYMDYRGTTTIGSLKPQDTYIICPLTRPAANLTQGAEFFVDLMHYGSKTTCCNVMSKGPGHFLYGLASKCWTGNGFGSLRMNLTGAGKSDTASDYALYCTIPGSSGGQITGIHSREY